MRGAVILLPWLSRAGQGRAWRLQTDRSNYGSADSMQDSCKEEGMVAHGVVAGGRPVTLYLSARLPACLPARHTGYMYSTVTYVCTVGCRYIPHCTWAGAPCCMYSYSVPIGTRHRALASMGARHPVKSGASGSLVHAPCFRLLCTAAPLPAPSVDSAALSSPRTTARSSSGSRLDAICRGQQT